MAKTRSELVTEIARRFGSYHDGEADSGSTTTIRDDTLIQPDDYWNGHYAYVKSADDAAPEGEERAVTDYVQATYTLTLAPAYTAAVADGDTYDLLPYRRSLFEAAVNAAIRATGITWLVEAIDTSTVSITADTYIYTLPADIVNLLDVQYRDDSEEPWRPLDPANWSISGTMGAQSLILYTLNPYEAGDALRLVYLARLSELTTDAGTLDIGAPGETELVEFIANYALYYLHSAAASRSPQGGDFRARITMAGDFKKWADEVKANAPRFRSAGRYHLPKRPEFERG